MGHPQKMRKPSQKVGMASSFLARVQMASEAPKA
jgi:hypothetical protein